MSEENQSLLNAAASEPKNTKELLAFLQEALMKNAASSSSAKAPNLRDAFDQFSNRYIFTIGQMVRWKRGMKDRVHPAVGDPAIVIEILSEPVLDSTTEAGNPYFRAKYDLVCGVIVDGAFLTYHFESARFEPYVL